MDERNVLNLRVKPSAYASHILRAVVGVAALGIGLSWPRAAKAADILEPPHHRLEFSVSPGLPKCNDENAFRAMVTNWVRVRTLDPTAARKIVVRMTALRAGGKRVDLSLLDPEGQIVASSTHRYRPSEECFKVLYHTAFDTFQFLKQLTPPDPPKKPEVAAVVEKNSDELPQQPPPVQEKSAACPVVPDVVKPSEEPKPITIVDEPKNHLSFGAGVAMGWARTPMVGAKIGFGRVVGPLMFELDARIFPPIFQAGSDTNSASRTPANAEAYLASLGLCYRRAPFVGCLVGTGGVAGYEMIAVAPPPGQYSDPASLGAVVLAGVRTGAEVSLSRRWSLRFDVEGQVSLYQAKPLEVGPVADATFRPVLTGFVSVVPRF